MTKIVYDIETMDIGTLHPWQENMLNRVMSGGFKPGEMSIMTSGRNTGKSVFSAAMLQQWMDAVNATKAKVSDLVLDEGTVYGSRYYTVQPIGGNWGEMEKWCTQVFGEGCRATWGEKKAPVPERRWYMNNNKFWFKSEKDRTMFIMMWRA